MGNAIIAEFVAFSLECPICANMYIGYFEKLNKMEGSHT